MLFEPQFKKFQCLLKIKRRRLNIKCFMFEPRLLKLCDRVPLRGESIKIYLAFQRLAKKQ